MTEDSLSLQYVEGFLSNYKLSTAKVYRSILEGFLADTGKEASEVSPDDLTAYYEKLRTRYDRDALSRHFLRLQCTVLLQWYKQTHPGVDLIISPIPAYYEWRATPDEDLFSEQDFATIIAAIRDPSFRLRCRGSAPVKDGLCLACALAFYGGLSRSEMIKLLPQDFKKSRSGYYTLHVPMDMKDKPFRDITLPLAVTSFIDACKDTFDSGTVFPAQHQKKFSKDTFVYYMRKVSDAAEETVGKPITVRGLRTSCIYRNLTEDSDLELLAEHFGVSVKSLRAIKLQVYGEGEEP